MTRKGFINEARRALPLGYEFENLGGGTSRIVGIDTSVVSYRRGMSSIRVRLADLYKAYDHFKGERVSSTNLRHFAPSVFDSSARPAGPSCNCTFLFHLLQKLNLAEGKLEENDVRGKPYSLVLKKTCQPGTTRVSASTMIATRTNLARRWPAAEVTELNGFAWTGRLMLSRPRQ